MLIAHRGIWNSKKEENTLNAFIKTINNPLYSGFELDIYTSKDNEFVIHHSPLVDNKLIWNYSLTELKQKGIYSLKEILELKTDKIIVIDIKDININTIALTELLNKYHHKIYVMSFFNSVIKKINKNNFKIGVINYILNNINNYSYDFICLLYDIATPHMINFYKKNSIEVFLYGIDKKDKINRNDIYYIIDDKIKRT